MSRPDVLETLEVQLRQTRAFLLLDDGHDWRRAALDVIDAAEATIRHERYRRDLAAGLPEPEAFAAVKRRLAAAPYIPNPEVTP